MSTALRRTSLATAATALVALAIFVAGCGGGSSYGGSASAAKPASSPSGAPASIKLASTKLGKVLTDAQGRTLYLFEADKGAMSNCSGACATSWPPVATSGKPAAGKGIDAAKLGVIKRADGSSEATYNGHPLYTYAGDTAPGQTAGQAIDDFGAEWYVLSAAGNKIDEN
jgi:predicted lipoprotein with Yx(FWY)xxD motif